MADSYTPVFCVTCAAMQWHEAIGKPCEMCSQTTFVTVRPPWTLTASDRRWLRSLHIDWKN